MVGEDGVAAVVRLGFWHVARDAVGAAVWSIVATLADGSKVRGPSVRAVTRSAPKAVSRFLFAAAARESVGVSIDGNAFSSPGEDLDEVRQVVTGGEVLHPLAWLWQAHLSRQVALLADGIAQPRGKFPRIDKSRVVGGVAMASGALDSGDNLPIAVESAGVERCPRSVTEQAVSRDWPAQVGSRVVLVPWSHVPAASGVIANRRLIETFPVLKSVAPAPLTRADKEIKPNFAAGPDQPEFRSYCIDADSARSFTLRVGQPGSPRHCRPRILLHYVAVAIHADERGGK